MSIYWEIPKLNFEKVIEDLENGEIDGLKLEYADIEGNVVEKENGRARITDGSQYVWLYDGESGLGVKIFSTNEIEPIKEKLESEYGNLRLISEGELGIVHVG